MHKNVAIDNQKKRLPGNVTDYNETKYRVDVATGYQTARKYST